MRPETKLKEISIRMGAEAVGIASVESINKYAPKGHRPDDILPGAMSVMVIGGQPTLRGAWRSPNYMTHYQNSDFPRIRSTIATTLAKHIEKNYGYYALSETPAPVGLNGALSLKLCAEMGGLGKRSMAGGVILNRQFGLLSFQACITTMPLKADGRSEDQVCPSPTCVKMWERKRTTPCLSACPDCLSGEIEDGHIKWMKFDRRICSTRAQTLSEGTYQQALLNSLEEKDPLQRKVLLYGSFTR